MQSDGKIIVGTAIDNSEFDRELEKLTKKAEDKKLKIDLEIKKADEIKTQIQAITSEIEEAENELDAISRDAERFAELSKKIELGKNLNIKEEAEYASLSFMNIEQEESKILSKLSKLDTENDKLNSKLAVQESKIENMNFDYDNLIAKVNEYKSKQEKIDFSNIKNNLKDTGNSIENIIKKVTRWGLAVFGVRSAYMFIRQAMSTLSQYNEQMGTDIEYIRYVLASTLQPIIENIIQLVYKLLAYIGYIAKAWFGVNLFANASVKAFNKVNKGVQATNKSAKELQKTLAGFDEMNILQENGNVTTGGGGGGVTLPSVDLSNWQNIQIPKWIEWIAQNKNIILGFFTGLASVIGAIKIASFLKSLSGIFGILSGMSSLQIFGMIAGIAVTIVGIVKTISSLISFIKDPTWKNFNGILEGLTWTILGVAAAMIAFNATNPVGWITLAIGATLGLATETSKMAEKVKNGTAEIKDAKQAHEDLKKAIDRVKEATNEYIKAVDNANEAQKKLKEILDKYSISQEELNKIIEIGDEDYAKLDETQKEIYKTYLNNIDAQEKLTKATENLTEEKKLEKEQHWEDELAVADETKQYDKFRDSVVKAYEDGSLKADEARDLIERAMSKIDSKTDETFTKNIPDAINKNLDPNKYRYKLSNFVNDVNNILSKINPVNIGAKIGNKVSEFFGFRKGGIAYYSKGGVVIPKLASGGIINQPGRGVPITSAIGGEHGAEGVIPLTDSQQMALLGEAIGKYITINANITNTMNGRVISRELQKVQNDSDFAFNR